MEKGVIFVGAVIICVNKETAYVEFLCEWLWEVASNVGLIQDEG